jgi:octaprenyl-diphosphate synthase
VGEATFRGAALIELLHTATLVHDDVVDDSNYRRGFFSVNALWKNKIAVLVGDYLLSKGLLLSVQHKDFYLLELVSDAVRLMSEGELLQIEKARRLDITEAIYYEVIRQKTASLISACCAVGAASATKDERVIELMKQFGEKVGMAFQIKDDLFDYGDEEIGKPVGIDIKEKKMTLPLIYALLQSGSSEKRRIIDLIKNQSHNAAAVTEVISFVKNKGGLTYAEGVMKDYQTQARKLLLQLPESVYRDSMEALVDYTIERNK